MRTMIYVLASTAALACYPAAEDLTTAEKAAIASEIAARYEAAAEAIRATDVDAWVAFYENSEDLTFTSCIENGPVAMYRSWAARRDTTRAHYANVSSMNFEWGDLHTRVLARDVALVATTYRAEATDTAGVPFAGDATWVAVWVKSDGDWKMLSVAETWSRPEGGT